MKTRQNIDPFLERQLFFFKLHLMIVYSGLVSPPLILKAGFDFLIVCANNRDSHEEILFPHQTSVRHILMYMCVL